MKQIFSILALTLILATGCTSYKWVVTAPNENSLVGKIDRSMFTTKDFPWFQSNYDGYNTAKATDILYLKAYAQRVTFTVFYGTWCDDTRLLLPKFYRVLDEAQFPANAVTLYGVDREKKSLHGESEKFQITNVPTFIVYKDGKEIGRIVENVKKSIEIDLKEMLLKTSN